MNCDTLRIVPSITMISAAVVHAPAMQATSTSGQSALDFRKIRGAETAVDDVITPRSAQVGTVSSGVISRVYKTIPRSWSKNLERKFDALAVKEALGELTDADRVSLDALLALRRQIHTPLSGEEAMRIYLHAEKLKRLREALNDYVEFAGSKAYA